MLVIGKAVVEWVAAQTAEFGNFGTDVGIGWEKDGRLVAGVAYANWNGVNIETHIASDRSKRWMTRQFLFTILDYPFNQLKAKRISACVGEGNKDSRKFVEHLGFSIEARLEKAHPTGDLLIYRMFANECKYVEIRDEKKVA